jgi:hypothetical protein
MSLSLSRGGDQGRGNYKDATNEAQDAVSPLLAMKGQ